MKACVAYICGQSRVCFGCEPKMNRVRCSPLALSLCAHLCRNSSRTARLTRSFPRTSCHVLGERRSRLPLLRCEHNTRCIGKGALFATATIVILVGWVRCARCPCPKAVVLVPHAMVFEVSTSRSLESIIDEKKDNLNLAVLLSMKSTINKNCYTYVAAARRPIGR